MEARTLSCSIEASLVVPPLERFHWPDTLSEILKFHGSLTDSQRETFEDEAEGVLQQMEVKDGKTFVSLRESCVPLRQWQRSNFLQGVCVCVGVDK